MMHGQIKPVRLTTSDATFIPNESCVCITFKDPPHLERVLVAVHRAKPSAREPDRRLAVRFLRTIPGRIRFSHRSLLVVTLLAFGLASCTHAPKRTVEPNPHVDVTRPGWAATRLRWRETEYPVLQVDFPQIAE